MKVTVTGFGEAQALARQAELVMSPGGFLNHGIEEILQRAANEERTTHAYKNQTGHAQQGTASRVISESDDHFLAHLEMGEEYSSYLVNRGFSRFDEIAEKAKREVVSHVNAASKKLGGAR